MLELSYSFPRGGEIIKSSNDRQDVLNVIYMQIISPEYEELSVAGLPIVLISSSPSS